MSPLTVTLVICILFLKKGQPLPLRHQVPACLLHILERWVHLTRSKQQIKTFALSQFDWSSVRHCSPRCTENTGRALGHTLITNSLDSLVCLAIL